MARIRTIKPEFWTDSRMVARTPEARLLYIGLWNFADDSGVLENDPLALKMMIFPGNDYDVADLLDELVDAGRVCRATSPDGVKVLVIPRFLDHQKISHPAEPRFGKPEDFTFEPPNPPEGSGGLQNVPGGLSPYRKGKERKGEDAPESPPAKRGTRAPDLFPVTDELRSWAASKSITVDLGLETEKFLDHHRAKGTVNKDWTAAWRNWMHRAQAWRPKDTGTEGGYK